MGTTPIGSDPPPPPPLPGHPPPKNPVPATEPKPKPGEALVSKSRRYAMPLEGTGYWEINDMQRMFALVTIRRDYPDAERLAFQAWDEVKDL